MRTSALFSILIALILSLGSCTQDTTEIDRLTAMNTELQAELDGKRQSVESLLSGLESVQQDMRDISIREGLLEGMTVSEAELARSPQQQIVEDIALVDGLIQRNRSKIEELEMKIQKSGGKLSEFEKVIANLKLDVLAKERDLMMFKDNLVAMEANYASLLDDYQSQSLLSNMQDQALHRAYFVYGSKDELIANHVAQKSGGVLGVGKTWELMDDFNKDYFTEVDIRQVDRIPLSAKKVEVLSQHPQDAYELVMAGDMVKELWITDADKFWSGSRYLAILVE